MTKDEIDAANREYLAAVLANPKPTKAQWKKLVDKWSERGANVESMLTYGAGKGWLD